jgi:uncharacterized Zn finger protein
MTTDFMEVFSLEDGDTIVHLGELYLVTSIEVDSEGRVEIFCVDELGYKRVIYAASQFDKFLIVCDTDHLADA